MLVVLIVVPAIIVAVAVVVLLDRVGVLPRFDGGPSSRSGYGYGYGSGFLESVPKSALLAIGGLLALWILGWLVFLIVGLSVLAG